MLYQRRMGMILVLGVLALTIFTAMLGMYALFFWDSDTGAVPYEYRFSQTREKEIQTLIAVTSTRYYVDNMTATAEVKASLTPE